MAGVSMGEPGLLSASRGLTETCTGIASIRDELVDASAALTAALVTS